MTIRLELSELTTHQAAIATLRAVEELTERVTNMANEIEDLKTEVQAENEEDVLTAQAIADRDAANAALQARIEELENGLAAAEQAAADAQAGKEGAEQSLADALAEVRTQVDALKADNPAPAEDA